MQRAISLKHLQKKNIERVAQNYERRAGHLSAAYVRDWIRVIRKARGHAKRAGALSQSNQKTMLHQYQVQWWTGVEQFDIARMNSGLLRYDVQHHRDQRSVGWSVQSRRRDGFDSDGCRAGDRLALATRRT